MSEETKPTIDDLRQKAEQGDPSAMFELAVAYAQGNGVDANQDLALNWFIRSAKSGHIDAMQLLGLIYFTGQLGADRNTSSSIEWYQKASDAGSNMALGLLAFLFEKEADLVSARKWYQKAAEAGEDGAASILAAMLVNGVGGEVDIPSAQYWFLKLAKTGDEAAIAQYIQYISDEDIEQQDWTWLEDLAKARYDYIGHIMKTGLKPGIKIRLLRLVDTLRGVIYQLTEIKEDILQPAYLAHYTTFEVIKSILVIPKPDRATLFLRQYNVLYMNDPSEGKALIKHSEKGNYILKEFFTSDKDNKEDSDWFPRDDHGCWIYCTAFTEEEDRLDLWRMYSKDSSGKDATGLCLVVPWGVLSESRGNLSEMRARHLESYLRSDFSVGSAHSLDEYKLVKVMYTIEEKENALKMINPILEQIKILAGEEGSIDRESVFSAVRVVLLDLLYAFKDEEYKTEHEYRLLSLCPIAKADLDDNGKLYVKSEDFLFKDAGYKIIIGPKHEDPVKTRLELEHRIAKLELSDKIEVSRSKIPYR